MSDYDITGTEKEKKRLEEIYRRRRERDLKDFHKLLSLPEGRRFIWRMLAQTGMFHSSFTGNSETYFNEGKRDIGLFLMRELFEAKPSAFEQMRSESLADHLNEEGPSLGSRILKKFQHRGSTT